MLTKAQRHKYEESGFVVAKGFLRPRLIRNCLDEIKAVFIDQAKKMDQVPSCGDGLDDYIRSVMKIGTPERSFVYDFVRHIQSLKAVAVLSEVHDVLISLGMEHPISLEVPSLRFDAPGEEQFLTKCHQDIRSIRGSRCVTVWFPLRACGLKNGSVTIFEGSHRLGLLEHVIEDRHIKIKDASRVPVEQFPPCTIEGRPGDVVFMNSFCVHVSHPNPSPIIKINGQFFYNDARSVTFGDEFESLKNIPDYRQL